jgi:hypothetical protein
MSVTVGRTVNADEDGGLTRSSDEILRLVWPGGYEMDGSQFVRPTGHEAWTPAAMQRRRLSLRQLLAGLVTLIAIIGFSV